MLALFPLYNAFRLRQEFFSPLSSLKALVGLVGGTALCLDFSCKEPESIHPFGIYAQRYFVALCESYTRIVHGSLCNVGFYCELYMLSGRFIRSHGDTALVGFYAYSAERKGVSKTAGNERIERKPLQ